MSPRQVQIQAADRDLRIARRLAAPDQRTATRRQLGHGERFDEIVVAADVERVDAVGQAIARGDDQHRLAVAGAAHAANEVETVHAGQAEIDEKQIESFPLHRCLGHFRGGNAVDRETALRQTARHRVGHESVVFYHEYAHEPLLRIGAVHSRFLS